MKKRKVTKHQGNKMNYKCKKCKDVFTNGIDFDQHISDAHSTKIAFVELQLLEKGHVPEESKLGEPFRGKNKIIIARD